MVKISVFWHQLKGVQNPLVIYGIIPVVVMDTKSSWLGLHILKRVWLSQESLHVPTFKISAFWKY